MTSLRRNVRRNAVLVCAWLLFRALMGLVAARDDVRNEHSHDLWKPVLWEGSSALVAPLLALVRLRATQASGRLLATPWRWFAHQALWLPGQLRYCPRPR